MIRTKIICTLGPSSHTVEAIRPLVRGGMNVARMNFSHGSHEEHSERLANFRKACELENAFLPVLMDTKGPEIRTGTFGQQTLLTQGHEFIIRHADIMGNEQEMSISYKELHNDVHIGSSILLDDGLIELQVDAIQPNSDIITTVRNGGVISSKKSVNVPGAPIKLPALTEQDRQDIAFAVENDYDFVALSFCRMANDILEARRLLDQLGGQGIQIIAKIENQQGVDNIDEILKVCNGVMIARGD